MKGVAVSVAEGPVPAAFIARTTHVYTVPFVRPVKVYITGSGPGETFVHVVPPSEDT